MADEFLLQKNSNDNQASYADVLTRLRQKEEEQAILLCVGNRIAMARKREDLWNIITEQLLCLFGAKYYMLCLADDDGKTHFAFLHSDEKLIITRGKDSPFIYDKLPAEDGIFNRVLSSGIPLLFDLENLIKEKEIPSYIYHWYNAGMKEMMSAGLVNGHEVKGVLHFYADMNDAFSEDKFDLLKGIVDQLGTGIRNILANEKIEQQLEELGRYKQRLKDENLYLQEEQRFNGKYTEIIGKSVEMKKVFQMISRVAPSNTTVLLLGETGTGKELIARAIHNESPRRDKLMIKVNCAAMPASLIESELFGHEKGSFTGATERRVGKFELANHSTLFLDEIGELPPELQVKLLRVLQEKEFERVGGTSTIHVNVRIIAATNRNLEKEIQSGKFRSDLYYRLNVFPLTLPSLRKRKEDIPALVSYFIERYGKNAGKNISNISHKAMESLMLYYWPGNVRELEHQIERAVLLTSTTTIKQVHLPVAAGSAGIEEAFQIVTLEKMERDYILKVIRLCNGRISGPNGAAIKLGLPATTLISRVKKLGIKKEHFAQTDKADE